MRELKFTKMVASGNDFLLIVSGYPGIRVSGYPSLAKIICDRKYGAGADGLLVLGESKVADVKMRIFNADGSEAEMCGNGARCVALYKSGVRSQESGVRIETKVGIINSQVNGDCVKIKLTDPKGIKLDLPLELNNRKIKVNFINTGVPHTVIFMEGLDNIDVVSLGRKIRNHLKFKPAGTNVDFVEVLSDNSIKIRTYERGVEDETLACGTGAVAAALVTAYSLQCLAAYSTMNVQTRGKETLKVYFENANNGFENVWLEGKAKIVYKGVYNV